MRDRSKYFIKLQREGASTSTQARRQRERKALEKQIAVLKAKSDVIFQKIKNDCSHPVDKQKLTEWTGTDTLGNTSKHTDYSISCSECNERLASFSNYDEDARMYDSQTGARRYAREFPWEAPK